MVMVIDAMDLLYSGIYDGFCLVSSDSDFTRLALRIRESGLAVYGFGKQNTPESLRKACDIFTYTENLLLKNIDVAELPAPNNSSPQKDKSPKNASNINTPQSTINELNGTIKQFIYRAIQENSDENGWASLSAVGNHIRKVNSDFDPRNYNFQKLSDLLQSLPSVQINADKSKVRKQNFKRFIAMIQSIIEKHANNEGYANLSTVCSEVKKYDPEFNSKTLGHRTIPDCIAAIQEIWIERLEKNQRILLKNAKLIQ